jgi:hypothetical protein
MKHLLLLLTLLPLSLAAQSWCAPGADWKYQLTQMGTDFQRHMWYETDVTINGQEVQRIAVRDSGLVFGTQQIYDWFFYTVRIGDAVLYRSSSAQFWDTLYYYGVPGDRWWPMEAPDPDCPGLLGMLEIVDTCTVEIDGLAKRKWEVAMLDPDGEVFPGTTMDLVEGIGMVPFTPIPYFCTIIVEWYFVEFTSYMDDQIAFSTWPAWPSCDAIGTSVAAIPPEQDHVMYPNPGSNGFHLSGSFGPDTQMILSDASGRVVCKHVLAGSRPFIETSDLPAGIYGVRIIQGSRSLHVGTWVRTH